MKAFITLALIFNLVNLFPQDILEVDLGTDPIDFEDPSAYKYISLDTNDVWIIGDPHKDILFIPEVGNAVFTDTNQYYSANLHASIQFRLIFEDGYNGQALSFRHKYDFEEGTDGGKIETSYDNGISWRNILLDPDIQNQYFYSYGLYTPSDTVLSLNNEPGFTGQQTSFKYCDIEWCFSYVLDTVLIRFTMASDSVDNSNEGWLIDDVYFFPLFGGVESNDHLGLYNVYPNPANDFLIISNGLNSASIVKIYSIHGQLLKYIVVQDRQRLDISAFEPGLYFIIINDNFISKFQKF